MLCKDKRILGKDKGIGFPFDNDNLGSVVKCDLLCHIYVKTVFIFQMMFLLLHFLATVEH